MKNFIISLLILIGTYSFNASSQSIQKTYIRYSEKIVNNNYGFQNQGMLAKKNRVSNTEGSIVISFDNTIPDSLQIAINAAKKMWESKIQTKHPIFISIILKPLINDIAMIADVAYCENSSLRGCPCSLASQLADLQYGTVDSPDGCITLNSNIKWNCNFSNESTSGYNLPTVVLRGIARCLGFGASIVETNNDKFFFSFGWPTYFDRLLSHNNNKLSDLIEGGSEMARFIKSDDVFINTIAHKYKVYAPEKFVQDLSLCYFDDSNSLMSYSLGIGNVNLSIDEKTSDVLRAIGWNVPYPGLKIKCNDILEDGIGSSYSSHTFSLLKENENISHYNWKFLLKNKQGIFTQILGSTTEEFTIEEITNHQDYFVNINGDLEGRIECEYTLNGKTFSATPFSLSLELKPSILSISDISIINNSQYEFSLLFSVNYIGADYVSIEIEEEYNTTLRTYRFNEPYIAHIKTGKITNLYYSWITVIVSNKYGTTYETLEYPPTFGFNAKIKQDLTSTSTTVENDRIVQIQLYNIEGILVSTSIPTEFLNKRFKPGIYVKKEIFENGTYQISKFFVN